MLWQYHSLLAYFAYCIIYSINKMTKIEALMIARQNHLEFEVLECLNKGMTPEEALKQYNLL